MRCSVERVRENVLDSRNVLEGTGISKTSCTVDFLFLCVGVAGGGVVYRCYIDVAGAGQSSGSHFLLAARKMMGMSQTSYFLLSADPEARDRWGLRDFLLPLSQLTPSRVQGWPRRSGEAARQRGGIAVPGY